MNPNSDTVTTLKPNGYAANGNSHGQSSDPMSRILYAYDLESQGDTQAAREIYQQIIAEDQDGTHAAIAAKAIEAIDESQGNSGKALQQEQSGTLTPSLDPQPTRLDKPEPSKESSKSRKVAQPQAKPQQKSPALGWFYNLPIGRKQFTALLVSEFLSLSLVGFGAFLIGKSLQDQLSKQAQSEVSVMDINYNIKINQMGFGFRGQSDNVAVISAASAYASKQPVPPPLKDQVKKILENEIKARKIEYATLVGVDAKVIVSANSDRTGQDFNPNNLVSDVVAEPNQIKATAIVSADDLQKEAPPLPDGFTPTDSLIRYTATAVKDPTSQKTIAVLISGDIVNKKPPIVENTLKALATTAQDTGKKGLGGYSAVYYRKPSGEFVLATSAEQPDFEAGTFNLPISGKEADDLLNRATNAENGQPVTGRVLVGNTYYTMSA